MTGSQLRLTLAIAVSAALLVTVLAAPASAGEDKYAICHKPETKNQKTTNVSRDALDNHFAHGDYLGACGKPVLAIAYADLDGNHAFGSADVMNSMLVDTSGNGRPSAQDTVKMGRYPITLNPSSEADFRPWLKRSHAVSSATTSANGIGVNSDSGGFHGWHRTTASSWDQYRENLGFYVSDFGDPPGVGVADWLVAEPDSASQPSEPVQYWQAPGAGDDRFIDVEFYFD